MSVCLDVEGYREDPPTLFNPVTVVVLNVFCFAAITVGVHAAGYGWGFSLLAGWLGGAAATLTIIAVLTVLLPVASLRNPAVLTSTNGLDDFAPQADRVVARHLDEDAIDAEWRAIEAETCGAQVPSAPTQRNAA